MRPFKVKNILELFWVKEGQLKIVPMGAEAGIHPMDTPADNCITVAFMCLLHLNIWLFIPCFRKPSTLSHTIQTVWWMVQ